MSSPPAGNPLDLAFEEGGTLGLAVAGCMVALADRGRLELDAGLDITTGLAGRFHAALELDRPRAEPVTEHAGMGLTAQPCIMGWETPGGGFTYPSGSSIFDALSKGRMQWRVYVDENGPALGGIPQVAALKGVTYLVNTNALTSLASDLQPTRTPIRSSSQTTVMSRAAPTRADRPSTRWTALLAVKE